MERFLDSKEKKKIVSRIHIQEKLKFISIESLQQTRDVSTPSQNGPTDGVGKQIGERITNEKLPAEPTVMSSHLTQKSDSKVNIKVE